MRMQSHITTNKNNKHEGQGKCRHSAPAFCPALLLSLSIWFMYNNNFAYTNWWTHARESVSMINYLERSWSKGSNAWAAATLPTKDGSNLPNIDENPVRTDHGDQARSHGLSGCYTQVSFVFLMPPWRKHSKIINNTLFEAKKGSSLPVQAPNFSISNPRTRLKK